MNTHTHKMGYTIWADVDPTKQLDLNQGDLLLPMHGDMSGYVVLDQYVYFSVDGRRLSGLRLMNTSDSTVIECDGPFLLVRWEEPALIHIFGLNGGMRYYQEATPETHSVAASKLKDLNTPLSIGDVLRNPNGWPTTFCGESSGYNIFLGYNGIIHCEPKTDLPLLRGDAIVMGGRFSKCEQHTPQSKGIAESVQATLRCIGDNFK